MVHYLIYSVSYSLFTVVYMVCYSIRRDEEARLRSGSNVKSSRFPSAREPPFRVF